MANLCFEYLLIHVNLGLVKLKWFFQGTHAYSISNDLITRHCIIENALSIVTKLKSFSACISKDKYHIREFVKELGFIQKIPSLSSFTQLEI